MERRHFIKGLLAAGICPLCAKTGFADSQWSYSGKNGPDHWGEHDPENFACATGSQQSPVDISGDIPAQLPKIATDWKIADGRMVNNGHTIQIDMPEGSVLTRGEETYKLKQFHFHAPSEHHVKGKAFPMEAHFVHRNPKTGSLGVLAVFLTAGSTNRTFAGLAAAFPEKSGAEVTVKDIDPKGLLPASLDYWLYEGSLTTPPCSENVDWIVARQPVEVDAVDIAKFSAIYAMNARPVEPPHRRFILKSN